MKRAIQWIILVAVVAGVSAFLYLRSDYRKLVLTDRIYAELEHPKWSARLIRAKSLRPNIGSGDYQMLYLVDVRRVSAPLNDAISFYEGERERLGFKEFHVDAYQDASKRWQWEWDRMGLQVPRGEDILVLTQLFPANDGNIRRHEPVAAHQAQ
jgi:hypothetical protein